MAPAVAGCHALVFTTLSQNNILPNMLSLKRRRSAPLPHAQQETPSFSPPSSGNLSNRIYYRCVCFRLQLFERCPLGVFDRPQRGGRRSTTLSSARWFRAGMSRDHKGSWNHTLKSRFSFLHKRLWCSIKAEPDAGR